MSLTLRRELDCGQDRELGQAPSAAAWQALKRAVSELEPKLRHAVATEWARDGQFEHASIASFGRFALELLAVGAPAQLVEQAHQAAIDEVGHARLCFSLATLYAGEPIGPGRLPLDARAFAAAPELGAMVHATVLEGCVNETLAALEAQAASALAEPEAVREVLAAIERQEADHASLAFRFVSWAITVGGERVLSAAKAAFEQAEEQLCIATGAPAQAASDIEQAMARQGRLAETQRTALRRRAVIEVLRPAAEELLAMRHASSGDR